MNEEELKVYLGKLDTHRGFKTWFQMDTEKKKTYRVIKWQWRKRDWTVLKLPARNILGDK